MSFRVSPDTEAKIKTMAIDLSVSQADVIAIAIRNMSRLKFVGAEVSAECYEMMQMIADIEEITVPEAVRYAILAYLAKQEQAKQEA